MKKEKLVNSVRKKIGGWGSGAVLLRRNSTTHDIVRQNLAFSRITSTLYL